MPKEKRIESLPQFISEIESIAYSAGQHVARVFNDWLTMIVCALSMETMEEEYLKTVKPYTEKGRDLPQRLSRLFAELVLAMEGRRDMLGDIFMEAVSHGHNGQFFTPMEVCRLMAQMTGVPDKGTPSVNDPACGSGRCLLAVAEINPKCIFVGQDVDHACVQMLAINLALNGLQGFAIHGNTLTNEVWKIYRIGMPGIPGVIYRVSYEHFANYLEKSSGEKENANRGPVATVDAKNEPRSVQATVRACKNQVGKAEAISEESGHVEGSNGGSIHEAGAPAIPKTQIKADITFSQPLLFEVDHVEETPKRNTDSRASGKRLQGTRHRCKAQ